MKRTLALLTSLAVITSCSDTKIDSSKDSGKNYPTSVIVDADYSYVMQGDTFYAQVIPINAEQWKDQISFENTGLQLIESHWDNGVLKASIKADAPGSQAFSGKLKFKTAAGDTTLPFSSEFMVARSGISVKTNALIKDMENPIELSMAGIAPVFTLTANDAEIKGKAGRYTITPRKTGPLKLNVQSKDGKVNMDYEFEVFERK